MKVFSTQTLRFTRQDPGKPLEKAESVVVACGTLADVPAWIKETYLWNAAQKDRKLIVLEDQESGLALEDGFRTFPQVHNFLRNPGNNLNAQKALHAMQL